jgi:hypothetical protein
MRTKPSPGRPFIRARGGLQGLVAALTQPHPQKSAHLGRLAVDPLDSQSQDLM